MNFDHLILDASAFLHDTKIPIREQSNNLYSCPEVLEEVKDKAAQDRLQQFYDLKLIQYDDDDLEFCKDFAKKTGDYMQLSAVDLKLIAATFKLEKRFNGIKFINKTPKQVVVDELHKQKTSKHTLEDMSDWITPDNISNVYEKMGMEKPSVKTEPLVQDRIVVACMTSDFSVQNCLLQMGLHAVSPVDGLMIKQAKKIALRCHACFKVYHNLEKMKKDFCPHCGNLDTLKRVQYIVEEDGSKKVIINFKRPIRVKGTNQQLPKPRGGKNARNPILTADQRVPKALKTGPKLFEQLRPNEDLF